MDNKYKSRRHPAHCPIINKNNRASIVFITVCSKDRKKIFARDKIFDLLIDCWRQADHWVIGKFVIMPDHIHFFCANANHNNTDLSTWISYWKHLVSKNWPYKDEFPIWQRDFWDRQLRTGENYERKWYYLRSNPVVKGFVNSPEEWPYQGELNIFRW